MLTKGDLQAIQALVKGEVDPLKRDLSSVRKDLEVVKKEIKPIKSMQRDIRKIKNDTEEIIAHFDKRDVLLQRRVKRIEEHIRLAQ